MAVAPSFATSRADLHVQELGEQSPSLGYEGHLLHFHAE